MIRILIQHLNVVVTAVGTTYSIEPYSNQECNTVYLRGPILDSMKYESIEEWVQAHLTAAPLVEETHDLLDNGPHDHIDLRRKIRELEKILHPDDRVVETIRTIYDFLI